MRYYGDMALGSTIDIQFTTIGTTGLPTALAATTATTISIYPGGSTTQLTAGVTFTTNFDGITGLNHISVALTSGNGYAAGQNYNVVLATGTVDGVNVIGYCVASFSINNRGLGGGTITATTHASGAIVATTFAAGAITSTVLAGGAIHSTIFTTGAIAATTFVAGAITSTVLAAGAIHSTIFTTGAIAATTFVANAITSTVLAAGAITSTKFTTGSIAATTFIAGAITSTVLAPGAIHSTIFTTGSITSTTFVAGSITSTVLAAGAIHSTIFTTGAIVATTFAGVLPTNFSALSISASAGLVSITSSIKQNTVATGFMFVMTNMTTHAPATGLTVDGTRSIDGAAFAALTNAITEVGFGTYVTDLAAADTNGRHIMYRFTNATADDLNIEIITQP